MIIMLKDKGTYMLIIKCLNEVKVNVGSLGILPFNPDKTYVYVGSAFGPGGLWSRIKRHLTRCKKKFWHIDYLLASGNKCHIEAIIVIPCLRVEHELAATLSKVADGIVKGFGSSDCKCPSHLMFFSITLGEVVSTIKEHLRYKKYKYKVLLPSFFEGDKD